VRFVDTNVLLYAISRDPAEQDKAKRANDILAERDLALSVQVLQEFYVQATRASRPDAIGHQQAVLLIESFQRFPVQDITSEIMRAARKSCPKTSAMARTMAASGSPIRSAEEPNDLCRYRLHDAMRQHPPGLRSPGHDCNGRVNLWHRTQCHGAARIRCLEGSAGW
jgi:predicted nucleic acid-binding protein